MFSTGILILMGGGLRLVCWTELVQLAERRLSVIEGLFTGDFW